jgi:tetratricopeptide (TPR) repeat protein
MAQDDIGDALDLAASLRWAPFNTGHLYREVREWIESALARARTSGVDDEILARGLVSAGAVAGLETRSADAVELLTEAVDLLTELDASGEVVWCHMWLGAFEADQGHFEEAVDHTRIGLELAETIGSMSGVVYLANQHGENAMAAARLLPSPGHIDTARDAFAVAIRSATQRRIEEGLVRAEHGLALLGAVDDPEASLDACQRALEKWRRLGLGNRLILGLVCTARVAVRTGDTDQAVTLLDEAIDAMVKVGWRQPLGRLLETAAVCALMTGDRSDAAVLAGAASAQFPTPRWYVPIDEERRLSAARADDPAGWDEGLAAGRALDEAEVIALTRQLVSA